MGTHSIQILAFALLLTAAGAVAVQTAPSDRASVCTLTTADAGSVALTAMFVADRDPNAGLFDDAPSLIYVTNEVARESDGVTLVDVSDVTSCGNRKNII